MNILVLGWYYSSNLGDAVLCHCGASLVKRHFPQANVEIRDLIGRTAFSDPVDVSMACQRSRRRKIRLRYLATRLGWDRQLHHECWRLERREEDLDRVAAGDWDAVVFAGGQLFMDDLALYVVGLVKRFAARNIPVFFNACGTGPSCSPEIQKRLGQALTDPCVRFVSCRDNAALVDQWCGGPVTLPSADPALWADHAFATSIRPRTDTIGLGVMFPNSLDPSKTIRFWVKMIRTLQRRKLPWKLFTNGSQNDISFALAILERFPELDAGDYLCPAPRVPEELIAELTAFRSIVSFRLHSHIISASMGIPSVAVVWDEKVRYFFRSLGHEERCFTIRSSPEQILDALDLACREGLPRPRLEQLRVQASHLLGNAMNRVLRPEV